MEVLFVLQEGESGMKAVIISAVIAGLALGLVLGVWMTYARLYP